MSHPRAEHEQPITDIVKQTSVTTVNSSPAQSGEFVPRQVPQLSTVDGSVVSAGDQQQPLQVEQVKIKTGLKCCTVL